MAATPFKTGIVEDGAAGDDNLLVALVADVLGKHLQQRLEAVEQARLGVGADMDDVVLHLEDIALLAQFDIGAVVERERNALVGFGAAHRGTHVQLTHRFGDVLGSLAVLSDVLEGNLRTVREGEGALFGVDEHRFGDNRQRVHLGCLSTAGHQHRCQDEQENEVCLFHSKVLFSVYINIMSVVAFLLIML